MPSALKDGLIGFLWWVPEDGFEVRPVASGEGGNGERQRLLVPRGEARRFGDPFQRADTATLCMKFADLEPLERPILQFANDWGSLVASKLVGTETMIVLGSDPVSLWQAEICALWQARRLWEALRRDDKQLIGSWVSIHENDTSVVVQYVGMRPNTRFATTFSVIVSRPKGEPAEPDRAGGAAESEPGEVDESAVVENLLGDNGLVLAGWLVLRKFLDARLQLHVELRMIPQLVGAELSDIRESSLAIQLVPRNLLGALWLQFARAVDAQTEFRRCRACETWLKISKDEFRTNRITCSGSCRQKFQRKKKEIARNLHANGTLLAEISKETGSSEDTIKKWIKARRPRGRPRKEIRD